MTVLFDGVAPGLLPFLISVGLSVIMGGVRRRRVGIAIAARRAGGAPR